MAMKALVAVFEKLGCSDVATYIQSGNVVFRPPASLKLDAATLAAEIEKAIGFEVPVVLRTAEELEEAILRNPFPNADRLHVSFWEQLHPGIRSPRSIPIARRAIPSKSWDARFICCSPMVWPTAN
jgi:Protein of unknown function (DUF1697)